MKLSNKILASQMSYERRPTSLRLILIVVALATFVIGGGVVVVATLTATTTPKPGPIIVEIKTLQQFKTAAPIQ